LLAAGIHAMWSNDEYHRVIKILENEGILL